MKIYTSTTEPTLAHVLETLQRFAENVDKGFSRLEENRTEFRQKLMYLEKRTKEDFDVFGNEFFSLVERVERLEKKVEQLEKMKCKFENS